MRLLLFCTHQLPPMSQLDSDAASQVSLASTPASFPSPTWKQVNLHMLYKQAWSFKFQHLGSRIWHQILTRSKLWGKSLDFQKTSFEMKILQRAGAEQLIFLKDSQNRWASPKPGSWKHRTSRDMEVSYMRKWDKSDGSWTWGAVLKYRVREPSIVESTRKLRGKKKKERSFLVLEVQGDQISLVARGNKFFLLTI